MNPSADPSVQQAIQRLGITISETRRRQRLSQSDLAQNAGLSLSTVRRLEKGQSGVAVHALWAGFKALGMLDHFIMLMDSKPNGAREDDQCERLPTRVRQAKAEGPSVKAERSAPFGVGAQPLVARCGSRGAAPTEATLQHLVAPAGAPPAREKVKSAVRMTQPTHPWAQDDLFPPS